jgi:hypothetical protein
MPSVIIMPVNTCDMCGSPNVVARFFKNPEHGSGDLLLGFICQKCLYDVQEHKSLSRKLKKLSSRENFNPNSEAVKKITVRLNELKKKLKERSTLMQ